MINCKGCPFLVNVLTIKSLPHFICARWYDVEGNETSKDCKLEAITYSFKNKKESINFVPKDINGTDR